jgi:hypothetical protein
MGESTETPEPATARVGEASIRDLAPLRAVDHVCHVFLPFATDRGRLPDRLTRTLADIGSDGRTSWLPDAARAALDDRPVWQSDALNCSNDLHPQVRRLLGVGAADEAERGAGVFVLTQEARKLLVGIPHKFARDVPPELRAPKTPELILSKAARERLAARLGVEPPPSLPIAIDGVRLVYFRTGHAIAVADVRCLPHPADAAVPAPWLVEAVAALGHIDRLRWSGDGSGPPAAFSIADMLTSLVGSRTPGSYRRLFCYSFASFAEELAPPVKSLLAVQLCRRYTDHYRIDGPPEGTCFAQPFANVTHAFGVEGGATIVDDCRRTEFLGQYRTASIQQTYLPIVLLNYHEFVHLLAISQESALWPGLDRLDKRQIARLQALKHAIMAFRLFYRFSYVSLVGPHNLVHAALRSAFQLDRMLAEVSGDVVEIHAFLREVDTHRHEARFRLASVVGAAAIAFLTSNTIFKEVLEPPARETGSAAIHTVNGERTTAPAEAADAKTDAPASPPTSAPSQDVSVGAAIKGVVDFVDAAIKEVIDFVADHRGLIAVLGAVLVAALTGLITWRKLGGDAGHHGGHHDDGLLEHAIHETIVHRAKHDP